MAESIGKNNCKNLMLAACKIIFPNFEARQYKFLLLVLPSLKITEMREVLMLICFTHPFTTAGTNHWQRSNDMY